MAKVSFEVDEQERFTREEWVLLVKVRADWTCQRCGLRPPLVAKGRRRRLHAHHINHDETDHRLINGECLCISCHNTHHRLAGVNAFRNSEVQRELSQRASRGDTTARTRKAWATYDAHATEEDRRRRIATLVAVAAAQPAEKLSARAFKIWETRRRNYVPATHCARGHAFDEDNTLIDKHGWRSCKECRRLGRERRKGGA